MNAKTFESVETLKNGAAIRIRAIRPEDKAAVVEAFSRLEPTSVYTRFFQPKQSLSNAELKAATEMDFENVVALVVTVESGGREVIIGGGRYLVIDPSKVRRSAEIAFTVEEDYHGLGIAGRILKHLVRLARQNAVGQFEAEVLPQNKAMLAVFAHSQLPMKQELAEGVIHVTLSLGA